MTALVEQYRPRTWAAVVGQDKLVARIQTLAKRGLAGRAYWISGQSGTGKTSLARLLAAEVADPFMTREIDAGTLTVSALTELERESQVGGLFGEKRGRAYLCNESHALRKDTIRQLLVTLERIPAHVVWIFYDHVRESGQPV
jgi:DNA polymerase-3 subunit gamma/tau